MSDAARPVPIETLLTHRAWVDALARRLLADESAAADAAQETWVAAMRHPPGDEGTARSWLGRVLRNFAHERRRTDARRDARERASARPESSGGDVAAVVAQAELHKKLVLAVMDLEEPYRATILLRFFEGLPPRDVAARMAVPVETVRTRTRRAVEQLRERLDREHGGDRRAWAVWVQLGDRPAAPRSLPRVVRAGPAAAAAGGAVVGKKVIAAALLVALLGFGTWRLTRDEAGPSDVARSAQTTASGVPAAPRAPTERPAEPPPAPPPAAASAVPSVGGRVVDAAGTGVAGAAVVATPILPDDARPPASLASSRTAADGSFRIEVGDGAPMWTVYADAPDGSFGRGAACRPGVDVRITLDAPASLAGRVTDPDGRPVTGAVVRWISTYDAARLVRRATTGADGKFLLTKLPASMRSTGRWITEADSTIAVDADGFAPLTVRQPPDLGTPLDLRLSRGAIVVGRVVDAGSGDPVAGARVILWTFEHPDAVHEGLAACGRSSSSRVAEVLTGADGGYRFEHVACAGVHAAPQAPGGGKGPLIGLVGALADGWAPASDEVPVPKDGETVETALRLWAAATVEGRVVDAAGRPMADFGVSDWADGRRRGWLPATEKGVPANSARTGPDGRYRLDGVPVPRSAAATTTLRASPADNSVAMGFNAPAVDVAVRAGETAQAPDLVVGKDAPASAWIEVVDADDRPVWGARAKLDMREEATTGRDGRMRFWFTCNRAGIPPHAVTLQIRAPGFVIAATPEFVPSTTDPPTVRVRLAKGLRMSGRVVTTEGAPVAGAWISVIDGNVPYERAYVAGTPVGFDGRMPPDLPRVVFVGSATSAADGTFAVDGLPPGAVHVRAVAESAGGEAVVRDVASDATDVVLTLRARGQPERGDAAIEVVDETSGEPLRGASVLLYRSGTSVQGVDDADAPGVVKFTSVVGGTWDARVSHAGHVTRDVRFTISPREPVRVRAALARGATIRGKVIVPAGLTLDAALVALVPLDKAPVPGTYHTVKPASDGTFALEGLPAGRWLVTVWRGPGSNPQLAAESAVEIETRPGDTTTADVRAARAYPASFVVGEPKTYTSIGDTPSIGTYTVCNTDGRTCATGPIMLPGMTTTLLLPEGRFTLTVKLDGADPIERTLEVVAGRSDTVQVPMPAETKAGDGR